MESEISLCASGKYALSVRTLVRHNCDTCMQEHQTHVVGLYKAAGILPVFLSDKRRKVRETKVVLHLSDSFSASAFLARHPDLVALKSCSSSIQFLRIRNQIWRN